MRTARFLGQIDAGTCRKKCKIHDLFPLQNDRHTELLEHLCDAGTGAHLLPSRFGIMVKFSSDCDRIEH